MFRPTLLLIFLLPCTGLAQFRSPFCPSCPNGVCPIDEPDPVIHNTLYPGDDGRIDVWHLGTYVGSLDPIKMQWQSAGKSHAIDLVKQFGYARIRGKVCPCAPGPCTCKNCPSDCPFSRGPAMVDPHPGGVQATGGPPYEINGREVSRETAHARLGAVLEDDRSKPFLTAVLSDADRKRFLTDFETSPLLAPWKGKFHLNAYAPTDWHVAQVGLAEGISFQAPPDAQGRSPVRFRLRAYAGPDVLAQAIRDVDPNYKSGNDPDPVKIAADKLAKEKADKEAADKLAKEKADKEAADKLAKEKADKEAAEKKAGVDPASPSPSQATVKPEHIISTGIIAGCIGLGLITLRRRGRI
jgi:hypothetical protein